MKLGLDDKIALVTAASRGLGKAVALRLAQEGAHVAICARGEDQLAETASEIEALTGRQVFTLLADISESTAAESLVKATVERFGRVDVLG